MADKTWRPTLRDPICGRRPDQIYEYDPGMTDTGLSPDEYVWRNEGTLNRKTGLFYCTKCYIKQGQPALPQGVQEYPEMIHETSMVSGDPDLSFETAGRMTYDVKDGVRSPAGLEKALVISSAVEGSVVAHRPALDIDHPVRVVPSSTPGHHHLFIDVDMTWAQYSKLLDVLAEVGVIEQGYADVSKVREATYLRLPWVKKVRDG